MKKQNSKKILIILSFLMIMSAVVYISFKDVNVFNLSSTSNNSNEDQDIEIHKYTAEEYKQVILNDVNIPSEIKYNMITEVDLALKEKTFYDYWTIYSNCKVDSKYTCRPYFYIYSNLSSTGYPQTIMKIQHANIDQNNNGTTKQFHGTLYYNLEADNKLFWDLNGDFYNEGIFASSNNPSISVEENNSIKFTTSYPNSHYKYCHKSHRITF